MRSICILAILFGLSGCAGIGVFTPITKDNPVTIKKDGAIVSKNKSDVRNEYHYKTLGPEIEKNGEKETWIYDYGNDWCGALVLVVPLMLPVCKDTDEYNFDGDTLIQHQKHHAKFKGLMCSVFPIETANGAKACTTG